MQLDKKQQNEQLEDMLEIQSRSFTLSDIESIARNIEVRKNYEAKNINTLYSSMLLSLTHEAFDENEARELWIKITNHMKYLEEKLGRKVGISVASLDYLSNIKDILNEPKIIEEDKSEYISEFSTVDELTGLYLRNVFDVTLSKNVNEYVRTKMPLSLLMIDIDNFKQVNDQYGHQKGDEVLSEIGMSINEIVREMDLAARYGGEEMAIIMPNANKDQAFRVGERIRKTIQQLKFDGLSVTVSIGASEMERDTSCTAEDLIKKADLALYEAKETGKNRTVIWESGDTNETHKDA